MQQELCVQLVVGWTTMRRNIEVAYAPHSICAKYTVQPISICRPPYVIMQGTTVTQRRIATLLLKTFALCQILGAPALT
jgi:hypothetical protein